jgi:CBS-domain-containing membrane protein
VFAIYDIEGRRFRNSLERLAEVHAAQASRRAEPGLGGEDSTMPELAQRGSKRAPNSEPVSRKAEQAYREMLHISDRQAILHAHQIMSAPVTTALLTQDTLSAWEQLREQHCHQLPVLDERQRIVGMVSEHDLLRVMLIEGAELSFLGGKTVADIMSPEVITADPVTDVRRIARVMCVYGLSAVPIVDERDSLIGLVSRTDILNSVANEPPLSLWS